MNKRLWHPTVKKIYFTEQAREEARTSFDAWNYGNYMRHLENLPLQGEPPIPWPLYSPEGQAYTEEWNRLAEEHGCDVIGVALPAAIF